MALAPFGETTSTSGATSAGGFETTSRRDLFHSRENETTAEGRKRASAEGSRVALRSETMSAGGMRSSRLALASSLLALRSSRLIKTTARHFQTGERSPECAASSAMLCCAVAHGAGVPSGRVASLAQPMVGTLNVD